MKRSVLKIKLRDVNTGSNLHNLSYAISFCQSHVMLSTPFSRILGSKLKQINIPLTLFLVITIGRVEMLAVPVCRKIHVVRHSVTTLPLSAAILDWINTLYGKSKGTTGFGSSAFQIKPYTLTACLMYVCAGCLRTSLGYFRGSRLTCSLVTL